MPALLYGGLSAAFCLPLFEHPYGLGVTDWDQHLFYYGSVIRSAAYGQLPFWNPWYCGGNVLWQNPQVSLISPLYALAAVVPLALAMKVNIFLHYCIGFAGMHLLLRRAVGLTSLPVIAYLASLFVFSGSLALHLNVGHSNFLPAFFLPLLLHCFLRGVAASVRHIVMGGAVVAACLLSGGLHVAPLAAVLFGSIALVGVGVGRTWKPVVVAGCMFAVGVALAAPKVVPTALFVTGSDTVDTRYVHHPDSMTVDMLWRAITDGYQHRSVQFGPDVQKYGWWEYGNYVGWFGTGLALAAAIWLVAFQRRREHWVALSMVVSLLVALLLALGEFSDVAPATLLQKLPLFSSFRVPSRFIVLGPLVAALTVGYALRAVGIDGAPSGARRLIAIACLVGLAQLGFSNSAQFRNVFSLPPLGIEERMYRRAATLQIAAEPTPGRQHDSPMFRSLLEGVSTMNCYEPLQLARVAASDSPLISGEGPVRFFESAFTPNRFSTRVVVGREPARVVLNQSFSPGWSSNAGSVVRDRSGRPSVILPPGFVGPVSFTFVPPGLWAGLATFVVAVAASMVAWRHTDLVERVSTRAWESISRPLTAIGRRVDTPQLTMLLVAAAGFAWIYSHYPYRPTLPNNGWWSYWDQGVYVRSARAFAAGNWSGSEHWYPIGYPLLAAPFVAVLGRDPFLPVNFALFVGFAWLCFSLYRPILGGWGVIIPLFASLLYPMQAQTQPAVAFPVWSQFAIPWNTNAVAPAYLAAIFAVRANWHGSSRAVDLGLGVLLGGVAAVRPTDAVLLGFMLATYCAHAAMAQRRWMSGVLMGIGVLVCLVPTLLFMQHAHGSIQSPYVLASQKIGFSISDLQDRAYQVLLRSEETYGEEHTALYQLQPWLHLLVPLAIVWAWLSPRAGALPVGLALSSWLLYLSYNDLSPFNFLRFFLLHYVVWTLPVLACAGVAGGMRIVKDRRWRTAATVVLLALGSAATRLSSTPIDAGVTTEPVGCCGIRYALSFPSPRSVDAVDVKGVSHGNPIVLSAQDIDVVADDERLGVFSGYQVLRRPDGIRVIFNRHLTPRRLTFTLDSSFGRDAALVPEAQPVRFDATFTWPW